MTDKKTHDDKNPGIPPVWDLRGLFPSAASPEFVRALNDIENGGAAFAARYAGRVASMTGAELGAAAARYEQISETADRVVAYAQLSAAADGQMGGWASDIAARVTQAREKTLFFAAEIRALEEEDVIGLLSAPALAPYAPWIGRIRAASPHKLSEEEEAYVARKSAVAEDAWKRYYLLTMDDMRCDVQGRELTAAETLSLLTNAPDPQKRRAAWEAMARGLQDNEKPLALALNTLADLKTADDARRAFENPADSRHLENRISPETVEAMTAAVRDSHARTAHRYYAWKARKSGVARLHPADRNAPLPGPAPRALTWEAARDTVLEGFTAFSPAFAAAAREFFDENRIDARARAGKDPGAFCHQTVPSARPYILMSFFGTREDVATLAHELGHGVHQALGARQGHLMAEAPLTVAETASNFAESLAFRAVLEKTRDPEERRALIAARIEDILDTIHRQAALFAFEERVHARRREEGELSPEELAQTWRETQRACLGPGVDMDAPGAGAFWMNVPHFAHTPFYVYAYAFGGCVALALEEAWEKSPDKAAFAASYMETLSTGGTLRHDRLFAPLGLDTADPGFWKKSLALLERRIDGLIALDAGIEAEKNPQAGFRGAAEDILRAPPAGAIPPPAPPRGPRPGRP